MILNSLQGKGKEHKIRYSHLYNFKSLKKFVDLYISEYLTQEVLAKGKTEEEYQKVKKRKDFLKEYLDECAYGDPKERDYVKTYIRQLITSSNRDDGIIVQGYPEDYIVTPENINKFLQLNKDKLTVENAWKVILSTFRKKNGRKGLSRLLERYNFNRLRVDDFDEEMFYINTDDIKEVYNSENPKIEYEDHLDILVQKIYEDYKGNGVIDELLYQDIDEVAIGVTGLVDDIMPVSSRLRDKEIKKAYDSIVVTYNGNPIHFKFLSLGSWEELERINRQLVKYEQNNQFSRKDGYLLGFGKDGSRRTAAREPFGECRAAWVRMFCIEEDENEDLVKGMDKDKPLKGWEKVIRRERLLIRGGASLPISGPQGVGKTTKMVSLLKYAYPFYSVRIIEAVFEAHLRRRYPNRNIFSVQETNDIDSTEAYNFTLRTSGNINLIGEVRKDKMTAEIIKSGNRGSEFTIFTYHPNNPDVLPIELANSLLTLGIYKSLKEALAVVFRTIQCCIQVDKDLDGNRYYNLYEFIPSSIPIDNRYQELKGYDRVEAFMDTFYTAALNLTDNSLYKTVPIVEYDDIKGYTVKNTISDSLYNRLKKGMRKKDDRIELMKVFRPEEYIKVVLEDDKLDKTAENIENIIINHNIDSFEDIKVKSLELSKIWR
ncbi:ATPase, T2SS/T4P/T4SS family [Sporosalibacterium faouarense]|uniref:ATPase, T2SS/T4P/T4SS family n=1 Tax=Sporosalibacterium faouarense TaxID=516123 RepID=UPI00192CDD3E|nr:ATPase, T2SS/T4P/T4SS family [Sporosalibacterium faouarense]